MYDCSCESCQKINLATSSDGPVFKSVLKAAENAFKHLHKKGSYTPEDLKDKPYQKLIEETNKVFNSAVTDNDIPPEMLAKLQNDTFVFSGLRTHAQLLEASTMLMEDGKIRGFDAFANDFNKVNTKYNQNYLEAEWQFAVSSSQSTANWAAIDENGRYNLQYRTANDDRVRADHAALQDITLPVDDPFWMSYYPPNGWRCRCIAVEVLKAKYELADSAKANEAGDRATTKLGPDGKNRSEIFRFNPGAEQKVFPPKHPYNKLKDADVVKEVIKTPIIPKGLLDIEKKFDYEVPRDLLKHLEIDNFIITNKNENAGAYYSNYGVKKLNIPDAYISSQGVYSKNNVFVHEFGHAIDYQKKLAQKPEVKELMDKYREKYSADKNKLFKYLSSSTKATVKNALKDKKRDWAEQASDMGDIVKSLNPKFGAGHSTEYFSGELKPEREFLAHCFQVKFNGTGNKFIKRVDSELHDDMISLLDKILK